MSGSGAGHRFLDHTSEIVLGLSAPDLPTLLEEGARAFRDLASRGGDLAPAPSGTARAEPGGRGASPSPGEAREFVLEGPDPGSMLVQWLNELAFLGETEAWLPTVVESLEALDGDVAGEGGGARRGPPQEGEGSGAATGTAQAPRHRVRARGVRLTHPFVLVKAATLHNLVYREGPDGIEAEVTLDI